RRTAVAEHCPEEPCVAGPGGQGERGHEVTETAADVRPEGRAQQVAPRTEVVVDETPVDAGGGGDLPQVQPGEHAVTFEELERGTLEGHLGGASVGRTRRSGLRRHADHGGRPRASDPASECRGWLAPRRLLLSP